MTPPVCRVCGVTVVVCLVLRKPRWFRKPVEVRCCPQCWTPLPHPIQDCPPPMDE